MPYPRINANEPFEIETHDGVVYSVLITDMSVDRSMLIEQGVDNPLYRAAYGGRTSLRFECVLVEPSPRDIPSEQKDVESSSRWKRLHIRKGSDGRAKD